MSGTRSFSLRFTCVVAIACLLLSTASCGETTPPSPLSSASPSPATTPPLVPLQPEFAADLTTLPEAPRYDIRLAVDPAAGRVAGHQEIHYTNAEGLPLSEVYLRLFANTPGYGGTMSVTHLLLNGEATTPALELRGSALRLPLDPALDPGQALTLSLDFDAAVPTTNAFGYAQFSYIHGVMALPNVYPLVPVYDDEGWNVEVAPEYGDAVTSDIAFYTVQVTAPPTLTLVASGSCAGPEGETWTCVAAPARDFALVLGEDYRLVDRSVDGVVVNSYYYPGHEEGARRVLQVAADALTTFDALFGTYPYVELDVVETPTTAGGIEYPGLVVISEVLYEGGDWLEWVVVHEIAHQWWYGVVGNDQVDEPWLDEALVQYSTLLYYEEVYGSGVAADILEQHFVQAHRDLIAAGNDMPVGLPVAAYDPMLYGAVVYQKGPLYFHALRQEVGDEDFIAILQAYYRRYRYGIATPESFLTAVKIVTGDPHVDLFEEWIVGQ